MSLFPLSNAELRSRNDANAELAHSAKTAQAAQNARINRSIRSAGEQPGSATDHRHMVVPALLTMVTLTVALTAFDAIAIPWPQIARARPVIVPFAQTVSLLVRSFVAQFADLLTLELVMVALLAARARLGVSAWMRLLAPVVGMGLSASIYLTLSAYAPFKEFPPFLIALGLLGLHSSLVGVMALEELEQRRWRIGEMILSAAGFLVMGSALALHATRFKNLYPSLHQALMAVAFVAGSSGIVGATSAWHRRPLRIHPQRRRVFGGWALGLAAMALTNVAHPLSSDLQGYVSASTVLGVPQRLCILGDRSQEMASRSVERACDAGDDTSMSLEDGERVFVEGSHLPVLDPSFRLDDYNVLLISFEATRFDQTSLASPKLGTTPFMAELADRGAFVFTSAYSSSSRTLASMASALTMTYPSHVPMTVEERDWCGELSPEARTVPEIFTRAGFRTYHSGHGSEDESCVRGLGQGFEMRDYERAPAEDASTLAGVDDRITSHAKAAFSKMADADQRFFGWLFCVSPHAPYVSRDATRAAPIQRYRQNIANVDAQIRSVFEGLEATGLSKKTIVVLYADHGEEFGEHGADNHGTTVYSEQVHVPLVVWVPGVKGHVIAEPTQTFHVLPWLLLRGSEPLRRPTLERVANDIAPMMVATGGAVVVERIGTTRTLTSLVFDDKKVDYDLHAQVAEVYDRRTDPNERNNLFETHRSELGAEMTALDAYQRRRACKWRYVLPARP